MGGKHKQAQRTKNNARPSSSGRSAELLGSTIPQFVGFSGVKESGIVMPGFSLSTDDIDSSIDSNFQLVLKKMNKKDSTTKLKALQEFTELTKTAETEAIKAVLPFWPRLYCALATDTDHKVREATHVAHHQVVLKAKRNLAPFLKQLAGPWFTSQYDTYAPAASAAKKAFQDAFPENKIQEAIVFCQEEILSYICENLTVHTVQTLSNAKTTSPEDAEAKYQRVLISSLHGYALYLNTVSTEQIEKETELNLKIISNAKFWKLAKHKVAPVKAAWFTIITALCQKSPVLREKEAGHIVGSVFGNLDENEPTVLPSVWEAALSILSTVHEWWQHVSVEKLVLPKLWKVLKEGGQGNASVIFPNLLPVISHLPQIADVNSVYCLFFENMRTGLKHKNVIGSRSESLAVSTAFVECLQYIILKHQSDLALCEKLIKTQLFPLLEWSLLDSQASYKALFNQVATLIQYWSRNRNNDEFPNYTKYLDYFWSNLASLFQGLMLNLEHSYETNALSQLASRQIEFLLSLKHTVKTRKHLKVTFTTEKQLENTEAVDGNTTTAGFDKSYVDSLNNLAYKTCENFVKFVNEKRSKELIEHLVCLIQDFDTESFFHHLNVQFGAGNEAANLIEIYRKLLMKWLYSKVLCSKAVVDLVFLLFKYLKTEEKAEILNGFASTLLKEECLGWCIAQTLSHPHNADPIVHSWLCNDQVSNFLITIVEKELADECTPDLSLILKQAFTEKSDGELFISKQAVSDIIHTLNKSLLDPSNYPLTIDTCASFAAYISAILYTANFKLKYGDELFLAMFSLLSSSNIDPDSLSKDTLWEVNTAWQDATCILSRELPLEDFKNLTAKCADIVEKELLSNSSGFDIDHTVDLIVNFVKCLQGNNPLRINDMLVVFLKRDFMPTWKDALTNTCISAEFIRGHLCNPYDSFNDKQKCIEEENIIKYFIWMDLTAQVFTKPITSGEEEDEDDTDDTEILAVIQSVEVAGDVENLMLDLFYSLALAKSLSKNFHCTRYSRSVTLKSNSIKENLQMLTTILGEDHMGRTESLLVKKLFSSSWLWATTVHIFFSEIVPQDLGKTYTKILNKTEAQNSPLSLLHLTQVFAESVTYDQIWEKLTPVESIIVLRSLIHCDELEVQIAEGFSKIDRMQQENRARFMYESAAVGTITWSQTEIISEIMRLYTAILKYKPQYIQFNRGDLIIVPFAMWSANIAKYKTKFKELQTASFIAALSDLFVSISEYVQKCDKENVVSEWQDVFAQDIHKDLVEIWLYVCEQYQANPDSYSITDLPFLQEFGKALSYLDHTFLFSKKHQNLPKWPKLLKQCCTLLTHPVSSLQLWGYHMLMVLIPGLIEVDSVAVNTNTPHEKGLIFEQFKDVLCHTQEIVQSMLLDLRLGEDSCRVEPFTDSYTYTVAYFLVWDILLTLCEKSSTELCYQYADWLKKEDFLNNLLDNIYKLMPVEIMHYVEGKTKHFAEWFTTKFSVSLTDTCSSKRVEHMVCWIYSSALSQLPPLVRQWWSQQETRTKQIVERVTATYVSPRLCQQELTDVEQHETKFKNMVVKVHPSVREVVAVYTVDEAQMELIITLPNNYPLKGPDVQCNRQIYGTSHKQWLMQLKMCVQHQNGRIWDGLSLWNNNLDKKFDGVEECYICFAVLHQGTYQLPKLSCQTCRKKFHSACLYKWFSTSNKSTCPICRHLF